MQERSGATTMKGGPLTLVGPELSIGDSAPDAILLDNDLNPVKLSSYKGKICIISSVPSLDTPVCDMQTRRFNSEAGNLGEDVAILTVSMDLPFAQSRWCTTAGVDRLVMLSDHRDAAFGRAYGTLIKELRLNTRALFVLDDRGIVRYAQYVEEVGDHPDYEAALAAARQVAGS